MFASPFKRYRDESYTAEQKASGKDGLRRRMDG
jgi:hypothetical protein